MALRPAAALVLIPVAMAAAAAAEPPASFEAEVLPILNRRCTECHGISKQSGGLRLDDYQNLKKGSRKGPVIAPGSSQESRLIELITADGKKRMPPKGDRVPAVEVEVIRHWIDAGASAGPVAGAPEAVVAVESLPEGFAPVLALAGERQGPRLAIGRGASVAVERLEPGAPARREALLPAGADLVQSLAFSPDGRFLAAGVFQEVLIWDCATWSLKRRLSPHADRVLAVAWSAGGELLAAGGGLPSQSGEVKVWQPGTGKLMRTIPDPHSDTVFALDFHPDGLRLASAGADRMVHIFDLGSARRLARLEGHTGHVLSLAFSPDGKRLLSAGAEGKLKSWNMETSEAKNWNGHPRAAAAVAFVPDGKLAASAGADRAVRLWNPENGNQARALEGAGGALHALTVFAGGKLLAAGGADRVVRVHELPEGKLLWSLEPAPAPAPAP